MLSRTLACWSRIVSCRTSVGHSHHTLRGLRSRPSSSHLQQARAVAAQAPRAGSMDRCTDEQLVGLVKDHDCFVFDLDGEHASRPCCVSPAQCTSLLRGQQHVPVPGTIWKGSTVLTGVREALEWLRSLVSALFPGRCSSPWWCQAAAPPLHNAGNGHYVSSSLQHPSCIAGMYCDTTM
jgi:hypothetical protein